MATISESNVTVKRCRRCNYKTTDENEMHAHILEPECAQGSTSYTDEGLAEAIKTGDHV